MLEPNFSESQLQQAANSAFIRSVYEKSKIWLFAHILSLPDEFHLGWDTAYFLDWLPNLPLKNHRGCNFFVQYKLSNQYPSPGAGQWECWGREYFRFKIPHNTQNKHGKYIDDYHQWHRLKELADKKFPTFYATNATLELDQLTGAYAEGALLNDVLLLDVRAVKSLHKFVSFAPYSANFMLHSEVEEVPAIPFEKALKSLAKEPQVPIGEANERLLSVLRDMSQKDESWMRDLESMSEYFAALGSIEFLPWVKHLTLRGFLKKHLGVNMQWLPQNG